MISNQDIKEGVDQKAGQLKAILYLLQTNLEDFSGEVDRSYELLKIGERTDLSKQIEDSLKDPLSSIFNLSSNIDSNIKSIVHKIASSFIKKNAELINSAFKTKTAMDDLHYSIVLKEDNIENRNKIFDFFDKYDLLDISSKYPVYFQFVPVELKKKMLVEGDVIVE